MSIDSVGSSYDYDDDQISNELLFTSYSPKAEIDPPISQRYDLPSNQAVNSSPLATQRRFRTETIVQGNLIALLGSKKVEPIEAADSQTLQVLIESLQKELAEVRELQDILVKYMGNPEGLSVLYSSIKCGDKRAVELLLKHGADINATSPKYITNPSYKVFYSPLTFALDMNQNEIACFLIDRGAIIEKQSGQHDKGYFWFIEDPFAYVIRKNNIDMFNLFYGKGKDINKSVDDGDNPFSGTPIQTAACHGSFEILKILVSLGADVNIAYNIKDKLTPLDCAAKSLTYVNNPKNLDLVRLLVELGAKRNDTATVPCPIIDAYLKSKGV